MSLDDTIEKYIYKIMLKLKKKKKNTYKLIKIIIGKNYMILVIYATLMILHI